jgi:hypothetical protein
MIVRHGTRYPGSKIIRKMRERLPVLRDSVIQNHKLKRGNNFLELCQLLTFKFGILMLLSSILFSSTIAYFLKYSFVLNFAQFLGSCFNDKTECCINDIYPYLLHCHI